MEIAKTLGAAIEKVRPPTVTPKSSNLSRHERKKKDETNKNLCHNKKFTIKKFNSSSPGPDRIHYEIV